MKAKILKKERYSTGLNLNLIIYDEPEVLESLNKLAEKSEIEIDIRAKEVKRSLNSNNLLWEYIGKIADKMRASKEEIYKLMLERYGQGVTITVRDYVDMQKAGFKYYKKLESGTVDGNKFIAYRIYRGSSTYSQAEMSVLLDGTKQEAQELGILL